MEDIKKALTSAGIAFEENAFALLVQLEGAEQPLRITGFGAKVVVETPWRLRVRGLSKGTVVYRRSKSGEMNVAGIVARVGDVVALAKKRVADEQEMKRQALASMNEKRKLVEATVGPFPMTPAGTLLSVDVTSDGKVNLHLDGRRLPVATARAILDALRAIPTAEAVAATLRAQS